MGNFYKELRTECPGDVYINKQERKELSSLNPTSQKYKEIIKISNKRINNFYTIIINFATHHKWQGIKNVPD